MSTYPTGAAVAQACICLGLQRSARSVARRYDEALRPIGLTSGQFAILAAVDRDAATPLTELADRLGLDRTTLNRNLKLLEAERLVASCSVAGDRRIRGIALTGVGDARLAAAMPLWLAVQRDSTARLPVPWKDLRRTLAALA